jgi:4-cresol dehydrogenase (hydroxylating)
LKLLPPGIRPADFSAALAQFAAVVGPDWVFTSDEDLDLYRDAYSPYWNEGEERRASAAVAPLDTAQVQAVMRIANRYRIPVFPISTGKNLGYGGSAPGYSGSVVIDLKRMNDIEVDDRRHFAIVGPGVSYFDLYHHIRAHKKKVWIDCPEPGWGSVIGNAMDRGIGWTVGGYRDHFRSHCGLEVVTATGELIRTGMGAMPKADSWGQYSYGFGPYVDGLFSQGNFGIVTKMGISLLPEPEAYLTGTVHVKRRGDLVPLVDVVNALEHADLIGLPLYDSQLARDVSPELMALLGRAGGPVDAELDRYAEQKGVPSWEVTLAFYGPCETVAANWAYARRKVLERMPEATFKDGPLFTFPLSDADMEKVPYRVAIGVPNLDAFQLAARTPWNPRPAGGHLLFAPVIPKTGEAALEATRLQAEVYSGDNGQPGLNPWYVPPGAWLHHSFVAVLGFGVSRDDPAINARSRRNFERAVKLAAEKGWGEYRATPVFSDLIADTYSFNKHALRRFTEAMKDAVDPNGIIAPGRGGIWPRHLRKTRRTGA